MADRVTMADVAREAGVSQMTVSRVINQREDVSEPTRQRVLEVIGRLGYRPSNIARSLATRRTGTLGLVVPDISNPFFADIVRGVEHAAYAANYTVFLCNSEEHTQRELDLLRSLEERRVDGLILCSSRLNDDQLQVALTHFPAAVLINRRCRMSEIGHVLADDAGGAGQATRHLLGSGHREIGYLCGPRNSYSGQQRLQGHRHALEQAGIAWDPALTRSCNPSVAGGRAAARRLLDERSRLTALFCYNDLIAVGALQACAELNRAVPDRVAIVGFDDIPLAALVTPPLTTCRVPRRQLGVQALQILLRQIDAGPAGVVEMILPTELVVRASAPAARSDS